MTNECSEHYGLPPLGMSSAAVLSGLDDLVHDDVRWRDGRAFSLSYSAGPQVLAVAEEAYRRFSGANALNVAAFPSLRVMGDDVVAIAGQWLGATAESAGYFTSGGTESILMAVKAARDQFRAQSRIVSPNIVVPLSAHAAFDKAGAYFDVEVRRTAVQSDWRADCAAMESAIDSNTILLVGSAPQYPQGVIDDIQTIAALAEGRGINCHVDACMGGVALAYLDRLGYQIPNWNLQTKGVTSIAVDLHKFGYTSKGASVIIYANKLLRSFQGFITDKWLGGLYGSSGILGTKSGGPIASAWAVMKFLGDDGYLDVTRRARQATEILATALNASNYFRLLAPPDSLLLSFAARDESSLDVFAVADEMWKRGWYVDRQRPPNSIHCTVNAVHDEVIGNMIDDLEQCAQIVAASGQSGLSGSYAQ